MTENEIAKIVFEKSKIVLKELGKGLLENCYEVCLAYELEKEGIKVERQHPMIVYYKGIKMDAGYRADMLIEDKVIVELKSVATIDDSHFAQLINYLKLSRLKLGLLINFNVDYIAQGFKRVVNGL